MADYFTEFSDVLAHLTTEEEAWLRHELEYVHVFDDNEYADDELPENLDPDKADWSGYRLWRNCKEDDGDMLGFEHEFGDTTEWDVYLCMYAADGGDPEHTACLVQKFLKCFPP